jgi:hypothetical protein
LILGIVAFEDGFPFSKQLSLRGKIETAGEEAGEAQE